MFFPKDAIINNRLTFKIKIVKFFMRIILQFGLLLIIGFLISSCTADTNDSNESPLVGQWKATWETNPDKMEFQIDPSKCKMNGEVRFKENGLVEIVAYGYDGCVFMTDTMMNNLNWKISGDTLQLSAENDPFGLPYLIKELKNEKASLVLMEDIAVNLYKEL